MAHYSGKEIEKLLSQTTFQITAALFSQCPRDFGKEVAFVGRSNAGKSTLLSVLTSAKPKIADYPFTTLKPNLGIVAYREFQSFVIADIPGIIEGAAEGKGLGHYFLRHIERNSTLLFLVPADADDIKKEYEILSISATAMYLRVQGTETGNAWYLKLKAL